MTAPTSAYPRTIQDLLPLAREFAAELAESGESVSRNKLMDRFDIGAPKASDLIYLLRLLDDSPETDETQPADPDLSDPSDEPAPTPEPESISQVAVDADPEPKITPPVVERATHKPVTWPVMLLSLPAMMAIWSGWVSLGGLTGFGVVHPLPGIADDVSLNTAITLPIGMETYAAYALWVWFSRRAPKPARRFAKWSALLALVVGAAGQIAYHLMAAAGMTAAPWQITTAVACLPVAVLGMGAALRHLQSAED
jgi:hypothetical protein